MNFLEIRKGFVTQGVLVLIAKETAREKTLGPVVGGGKLCKLLDRLAVGQKERVQRRVLLRRRLPIMVEETLEFIECIATL